MWTISELRPVRVAVAVGASLVAFGLCSCGHMRARQAMALIPPGSLVVGPSAASSFGLHAGDTLPEIPVGSVPSAVVLAAERQAKDYNFAPGCTRFFTAAQRVLVLLVKSCASSEVLEDGQGMAVYEPSGAAVGRATPWLSDHYTDLRPPFRPAH